MFFRSHPAGMPSYEEQLGNYDDTCDHRAFLCGIRFPHCQRQPHRECFKSLGPRSTDCILRSCHVAEVSRQLCLCYLICIPVFRL
ncbi:hypothetical protein PC128_g21620 [Phytophthora cactorum]|nr:hypothetical protein PC120_g22645 [Phytophthora cactorum]KAG3157689.1 hypothetical protein PC128_g21620 [Phytophthora cactorum]